MVNIMNDLLNIFKRQNRNKAVQNFTNSQKPVFFELFDAKSTVFSIVFLSRTGGYFFLFFVQLVYKLCLI